MARDAACRNCRHPFLLRGDARHAKRLPFLLACGHTLCGVCISAARRKARDVITCTDCGSRTPYNSSENPEDQLVADVHTLGLVAARHLNLICCPKQSVRNHTFFGSGDKPKENGLELGSFQTSFVTEAKCEECTTKPAQKKCLKCDAFFCDPCFQIVHAAANTLRKHKAIPAYQASHPPPTCSAHPSGILSYYCRTEGVAVCPDCIIQSHKEHDVIAIEEAAAERREEVQILISDAQSVLSTIKNKKQEVEASLREVEKRCLSACASMEHQMRQLYTQLQRRELALQGDLSEMADLQVAALLEMGSVLDGSVSRTVDLLVRASDCLKTDVTLMLSSDQICESLRDVNCMVLPELPTINHISFQLSAAVRETINTAGAFEAVDRPVEVIKMSQVASPSPLPEDSALLSPCPSPISLPPDLPAEIIRSSLSPLAIPFSPRKTSSKSGSRSGSGSSTVSSLRSRSASQSRAGTPIPPPQKHTTVPVWVSSIESPAEFYIQYKVEEEQLQEMALGLNETLNTTSEDVPKEDIQEELKLAAMFSEDDLWYRAEVLACYLSSSPAYVTVLYLDYGNTENVGLMKLAKLPEGFECGPFFAHKCLLSGLQPLSRFSNVAPPSWSAKAITQLKNFVFSEGDDDGANVTMREVRQSGRGWKEVELYIVSRDGSLQSVGDRLVRMGLASRSSESRSEDSNPLRKKKTKKTRRIATPTVIPPTPVAKIGPPPGIPSPSPHPPSTPVHPLLKSTPNNSARQSNPPPDSSSLAHQSHLPSDAPTVGHTLEVTVVQVNTPGEFYVQFPSYLTTVHPLLAELPQELPTKSGWTAGEWCLTSFQGSRWYRGEVMGAVGEERYEVRYLDFGNHGVVPAGELAVLPWQLEECGPQAVRAGLAGVVPVDGAAWGIEASVYFSGLVLEKVVSATVESVSADASIEVRLRLESQESQEVGDLLVSVGHAHSGHTHKKLRPPTDDNGSLSGGGTDGEGVVLLNIEVTTNGDVSENSTHLSDDESAPRPVSPSQSPPRIHQTPSDAEVNPKSPDGPPPPTTRPLTNMATE